jgi:hypothetical protein
MENSVLLLIMRENYLSSLLKNLNQTWISTYFTSKQSGVHTERTIMKEMYAYMLIIGKIIDVNPQYSVTLKICARIGILRISLLLIKMVAS